MECKCVVSCSVSEISIEKAEKLQEIQSECTSFDFGSVTFGTKVKKVFEIKNNPQDDMEYTVNRDPNSNPIYQTFDFHYTRVVPKNGNFKCVIWYKPNLAPWWNVDTLHIEDKNGKSYKLILKGNCVGPAIQISCIDLRYFVNDTNPTLSKTIELQNIGIMPAKFRFDIKNKRVGRFRINVTEGVIEVGGYIFVTITFEPKAHGIYSNTLHLLTLHTRPKRIELIGYYTKNEIKEEIKFRTYKLDDQCKIGFTGYLNDVVDICETPPLFSLTNSSLDFGTMEIKTQEQSRTLVTCLSNNLNYSIKVIWDKDPRGIFKINPKDVSIPANNSVLLECVFKPNEPNAFYDDIISGRIFWGDEKDANDFMLVPMCAYLRFLGSTFPPNKAWIPQLSFPNKVIVRPALPNCISHDSFEMKLTGHLPVSYRFVPPKSSRFTLKPNQGVVSSSEFIIVQFFADGLNDEGCIERWILILNGTENQCHFVFFSSYVEKPKVLVNKENRIRFANVLPGCYDVKPITLKNISVQYLMFRLHIQDKRMLYFNQMEGLIIANEEITLECTATALREGVQYSDVAIELRKVAAVAVTGPPFTMIVRAKIKGIFSELCALPSVVDLDTVRVHQPLTSEFNLFNFGESRVCFKLLVCSDDENNLNKYVDFIPRRDHIEPGQHRQILMNVNCTENGQFVFYVCYKVRLHQDSNKMLDMEPTNLIKVTINVEYPTLQVIAITDYTHGECFSKTMLWNMMNINKLNHELKVMKRGEKRTVDINLPHSEISENPFSTTLVLQNQSTFETEVNLKRNKLCDCSKINVSKSISFRESTYDCRHRHMFMAYLSNNTFKPWDHNNLTFKINYDQPETIMMSYLFQLPENMTVFLYFYFNILAPTVDFPSRYFMDNTLHLPPVALCERDPAFIPMFFYNQSSNEVQVGLTDGPDDKSQYDKNFRIMECLNSDEMSMRPYTQYAIFFRFQPLQFKKYTSSFNLMLGTNVQHLRISSTGIDVSSERSCCDMVTKKIELPEPDITYSTDYLKVTRMVSWSCAEVLLFAKNNTDDVIGYSMRRNVIEGVISVCVINNRGILKPRETRALIVYIQTFDTPAKINLHLVGKFLSHTQYFRHKKSILNYNLQEELINDEFTITEKGEQRPKLNDTIVQPMPKNFFRTITLKLTNISAFDIDLHMEAEEQLKQSPQYLLELDENRILKSIAPEKMKDEEPVPALAKQIDRRFGAGDQNEELRFSKILRMPQHECANLPLIKDVIDCMLLTVLESKVFKEALQLQLHSDPPYYIQFQSGDEFDYTVHTSNVATVKKELNPCQGPTVAAILRNLLCDGIHHVMQLGPSPGNRNDRDYIYDKTFRSQYTT